MTIRCGGRQFKTHRAIVCIQSDFFDTAVRRSLRDGTSGIVDLPDDDPDAFESFLEFLYTGSYNTDGLDRDTLLDAAEVAHKETILRYFGKTSFTSAYAPAIQGHAEPEGPDAMGNQARRLSQFRWSPYAFKASPPREEASKKRTPKQEQMKRSVQVYLLADKYSVGALQLLACDRFFKIGKECCVETEWTASWNATAFFSDIVKMIYGNTTQESDRIRKALVKIVGMKTFHDLMKERMREEMKLNGELAVGVLDYLNEENDI